LSVESAIRDIFKTTKEREQVYKDLEEQGRDKAYNRDDLPKSDKDFFEKIAATAQIMRDELAELNMKKESRLPLYVGFLARDAMPIADHCEGAKITRKECLVTEKGSPVVWGLMGDVNTISLELLKRKCSFLFGEVEPYNLSSLINDVTACYHRALEIHSENVGKWQKEGKCSWRIK